MRELYRPALPVARLLVVALGLLGFVVGPAGSGTQGGTSSNGAIAGARTWTVQHTPARSRASTKQRPGGRVQAQHVQAAIVAAARQAITAATPDVQAAQVALPVPGIEVRPPSGRAVRPAATLASPDIAPRGVPRGRAPPSSTRI